MVTEEYLLPTNINLDTSANLKDPSVPQESKLRAITLLSQDNTISSYNRNIMQICVLVEGLGQFAVVCYICFLLYLF